MNNEKMKKIYRITVIVTTSIMILLIGRSMIKSYLIYSKVQNSDPAVWEKEIQRYESADKKRKPFANGILFVGSSTFKEWESLRDDMRPMYVINRGFGGARMSDLLYYADRIIIPYNPKLVVLYAGDNDLTEGEKITPEKLLENTKKLTQYIHEKLPDTKIYFISIKPCEHRWSFWPEIQKANQMIKDFSVQTRYFVFIDIASRMLTKEGQPVKELFMWDGLHLNERGYHLWARTIREITITDY